MDSTRFTADKTGDLVRIQTNHGSDVAFVPHPLPPNWSLPSEFGELLGDAREAFGTLNGIGQTLTSPQLLLTPLQQREAIKSSSMEGTYATPMELLKYELDPQESTSNADKRSVWQEVHNHSAALQHGFKRMSDDGFPMSLRLIREMHARLLGGVRGQEKTPGEFRTRQVHIGSDYRFIPPPPDKLEECLNHFESYLHDRSGDHNPLVLAYITHYHFETIHPFLDGNGRIGRVLLSLLLCDWHGHALPWLYMSAYFDRYKDEYTDRLFKVSTEGDWSGWIEFCLRGTIYQCNDTIRRCKKLNDIKQRYYMSFSSLTPRAHQIIGKFFDAPVFRARDVMRWCGVSNPTAHKYINKFIKAGIVDNIEGEKPKLFFAPEIFRASLVEGVEDSV